MSHPVLLAVQATSRLLVFLVKEEVKSLYPFRIFMPNPQLNTILPAFNKIYFKPMNALWPSTKDPAGFHASRRLSSELDCPRLGLLKESGHFLALWCAVISTEFHLPNPALSRERGPFTYSGRESSLYFSCGLAGTETWDNDFRQHRLSVVTWVSSQEKYVVEGKGQFASEEEEGPRWWRETWPRWTRGRVRVQKGTEWRQTGQRSPTALSPHSHVFSSFHNF